MLDMNELFYVFSKKYIYIFIIFIYFSLDFYIFLLYTHIRDD